MKTFFLTRSSADLLCFVWIVTALQKGARSAMQLDHCTICKVNYFSKYRASSLVTFGLITVIYRVLLKNFTLNQLDIGHPPSKHFSTNSTWKQTRRTLIHVLTQLWNLLHNYECSLQLKFLLSILCFLLKNEYVFI